MTAAKLTALQTSIDGFKAIVSKPRDNIVAGATVTQELSSEFDAADETLAEILDSLIGQFQAINAKFVSDYNNAWTIVDTSASHANPNPPTPAPTPAAPKPRRRDADRIIRTKRFPEMETALFISTVVILIRLGWCNHSLRCNSPVLVFSASALRFRLSAIFWRDRRS